MTTEDSDKENKEVGFVIPKPVQPEDIIEYANDLREYTMTKALFIPVISGPAVPRNSTFTKSIGRQICAYARMNGDEHKIERYEMDIFHGFDPIIGMSIIDLNEYYPQSAKKGSIEHRLFQSLGDLMLHCKFCPTIILYMGSRSFLPSRMQMPANQLIIGDLR